MYTDLQLANAILRLLVLSRVMTAEQLADFSGSCTEQDVRRVLAITNDNVLKARFSRYWVLLGAWLNTRGGNIHATTATSAPGRYEPALQGAAVRSMYSDCFRDVNMFLNADTFRVVKAISNHLRFGFSFQPDSDSDLD